MGKKINEMNIQRYLKRKPQLLAHYRRGHRPGAQELVRITCVTPPPQPEFVFRLPGTILGESELFFTDCKDYLRSSRDSGSWTIDEEGFVFGVQAGRRGSEIIEDVLAKFFVAADLLSRSDFSGAFKVLDLAFRSTAEILSLNIPRVLSFLLAVFARLDMRGQRDTLNVFRIYLRGQADGMDDRVNPKLRTVLRQLSALDVGRYCEMLPRIFDLMIEQSDELFGRGSNLSLDAYWDRYGAFVIKYDTPGQVRSIQKQLDKIPPDAKQQPWILRHQRLYAWKTSQVKRDEGRYDEAQAALRTVEHTYANEGGSELDAARHWCFAAIIEEKRGDMLAAEAFHRLALRMSMKTSDEDAIQFAVYKLTGLLDQMDRKEEAERVREYARSRISDMAAQVEWNWEEFQRRTGTQPAPDPAAL